MDVPFKSSAGSFLTSDLNARHLFNCVFLSESFVTETTRVFAAFWSSFERPTIVNSEKKQGEPVSFLFFSAFEFFNFFVVFRSFCGCICFFQTVWLAELYGLLGSLQNAESVANRVIFFHAFYTRHMTRFQVLFLMRVLVTCIFFQSCFSQRLLVARLLIRLFPRLLWAILQPLSPAKIVNTMNLSKNWIQLFILSWRKFFIVFEIFFFCVFPNVVFLKTYWLRSCLYLLN